MPEYSECELDGGQITCVSLIYLLQLREIGKRKTIVIVAEGAIDANLNPIRAEYVKDVLTDRLGLDTRVTCLGHTQRGGRPCAYDRILVCPDSH